ncbi:4'-phosphopantetheinyl transferase family protein [Sporomusa malonica]|uniref:4'-phosphopantetheinyl transferase n=1 Tax=Sporomusa malonica TaxID=112901 RepID=A0A1W2CNF9_9FIRM|nr:4'-phosphopantetheinyl transferase superfamily protein [Sporomusa malonica]SMC86753.1 4'-phosphopantetheinyl transferase [Sporomusa malonica]
MIYLFDNINSFTDGLFWRSLQVIPPERAAKATQYRSMRDRKLSVIAYLLLMYGLKKEHGITEKINWGFGENGKPYLSDYPDIFFNISHCKCGVVCAISNEDIGIDIEEVGVYEEEVAKYICNVSEYNSLKNSNEKVFDFCKLWTVKESVLKFTGEGICTDLKNVLNNIHLNIETVWASDHRYVISICKKMKENSTIIKASF